LDINASPGVSWSTATENVDKNNGDHVNGQKRLKGFQKKRKEGRGGRF